jgi:CRISPR-associated protein Cmr4
MSKPDFRVGYLYSLAPIHCGGEGDLGNILEIVRESHTNFPYVPGSSLRGSLRNEVAQVDPVAADRLFGKELAPSSPMGVHQVWFGDARLLWIPMRTMALQGRKDVFTWVSCHSLIRDHALLTQKSGIVFPDHPVGTRADSYIVADAQVIVKELSQDQKNATNLAGTWPKSLKNSVQPTWDQNRMILSDADFQVLMEHSLWTQVRNKIQDTEEGSNRAGAAETFWTDVCIPRDTILYYPWGYSLLQNMPVTEKQHLLLMKIVRELFQVGGQANIGRGWVQGWVSDDQLPTGVKMEQTTAGAQS